MAKLLYDQAGSNLIPRGGPPGTLVTNCETPPPFSAAWFAEPGEHAQVTAQPSAGPLGAGVDVGQANKVASLDIVSVFEVVDGAIG